VWPFQRLYRHDCLVAFGVNRLIIRGAIVHDGEAVTACLKLKSTNVIVEELLTLDRRRTKIKYRVAEVKLSRRTKRG
jgi:hypothetical protein